MSRLKKNKKNPSSAFFSNEADFCFTKAAECERTSALFAVFLSFWYMKAPRCRRWKSERGEKSQKVSKVNTLFALPNCFCLFLQEPRVLSKTPSFKPRWLVAAVCRLIELLMDGRKPQVDFFLDTKLETFLIRQVFMKYDPTDTGDSKVSFLFFFFFSSLLLKNEESGCQGFSQIPVEETALPSVH